MNPQPRPAAHETGRTRPPPGPALHWGTTAQRAAGPHFADDTPGTSGTPEAPAAAGSATAAAAPDAEDQRGLAGEGRTTRLLVIDDDIGTIQQLGRLLTGFAQVSFATNGMDGLAIARSQLPDLILLDANMPGLSGFEVCQSLKTDAETAAIPVMFVTGERTVDFELAALKLGAVDFLRKPLEPVQVLARLRLHLRGNAPLAGHAGVARVLIVDDDASAIQLIRHVLQGLGECHFSLDGEQALQLAPSLQPDLILLDVDLPGADGFAVCRRLKRHEVLRHVPVVFITQMTERGQEARALALGADDFITKPYDAQVLRARLGRLIARKQAVDADLQALRQQSQRLSDTRVAALVAAASDAIVVADAAGHVVLANAAASALFGVGEAELLGQPMAALWVTAAASPPAPALAVASGLRSGAGQLRRQDGTCIDVELAVSSVGSGADALLTVIVHDLRERERREASARLVAQAQASRRAIFSTLSFIAHEMGNPLNAISGLAQLMQSDRPEAALQAHARHLQLIADASQQLQALMKDVIDLAQLDSGQLRVEPRAAELCALLVTGCEQFQAQATRAGVTLERVLPPAPLHALADPRRLAQCLGNLLSNALKYGRTGGRVVVALRARGDAVVLSVADDGRGMNPQQLAQLFEPYNRLGQEATSVPGVGLGLALTRQLVQAMNGQLEVDSQEGVGSVFSIVLARSAAQA